MNITTDDGLIEFMYDVQWGTMSPTVWAHNDAHDGNVFIRDAEPGASMEERLMLIDFDDFLNAYLREYNRIGARQFSYTGSTD